MSNKTENPTIRLGDSGNIIQIYQLMLEDLGFSVGSCGADGVYGLDSRKAVLAFRESRKLGLGDFDWKTQILIREAWWRKVGK